MSCTPRHTAPAEQASDPTAQDVVQTAADQLGPLVEAADARLSVMGRVSDESGALTFGYPGVTLRFCFSGTQFGIVASSTAGRSRLRVRVDDKTIRDVVLPKEESELHLWSAPRDAGNASRDHCVELVHLTETWLGVVTVKGIRTDGQLRPPLPLPERRLLFIGDSVTCGEALLRQPGCQKNENWWDPYHSYGPLVARAFDAQYQLVCFGGKGVVRDWQGKSDVLNAPQFFPLVIPDERNPTHWEMSRYIPDAVVVSLGTNDFNLTLGAFPAREHFVETYVQFVEDILREFPSAKVLLTEGAIVNDDEPGAPQKTTLREYLREVVRQLESSQVAYVEANHYPGDTCDFHPTTEQHAKMAGDLAKVIGAELGWEL